MWELFDLTNGLAIVAMPLLLLAVPGLALTALLLLPLLLPVIPLVVLGLAVHAVRRVLAA
jgi:hypothetical protein